MSEQVFLIAKSGRDWKNISQYQDERQQGRKTARNAGYVAGAGGTLTGASLAASGAFPAHAGTVPGAVRDFQGVMADRNFRRASLREMAPDMRKYYPGEQTEATIRAARRGGARMTRSGLAGVVRRNPVVAGLTASGALYGAGAGMYVSGRSKARNAERNIARLRRERAGAAKRKTPSALEKADDQPHRVSGRTRRNAKLTNRELDTRMRRGSVVLKPLGTAGELNPVVGTVGGILGGEKDFRIQRGANYQEARTMQGHEQKRHAAELTGTAGGLVAGEGLKNLKDKLTHPKALAAMGNPAPHIRRLAKEPKQIVSALGSHKRLVGGGTLVAGSTAYSQYHKRKKGQVEDQTWERLVREHPDTRGV